MKFTKLAALFKNCTCIHIVKFDGDMWLGNGIAAYRIEGDIKTDDKGLCSLLNIPEDKREYISFERDSMELIKRLKIMSDISKQVERYKLPICYTHHDKATSIYATEFGACIYNKKLIDIAGDIAEEYITYIGEIPMLGLWDGHLKAIVTPMNTLSDREFSMLERFVVQVRLARQNERLLPEESEQIEFDDYPFDQMEA